MDVLGFSELVYNKDRSRIESYFSYIESDLNKHLSKNKFNYLVISDSIVISAKKTKENLSELVFLVSKIQYQLILKGILVRGAISFGKLYINKSSNIIVGPGLINAYRLESSAKYPRIILDRQIIPELFDSTKEFMEYTNSFFLKLYGETDGKIKIYTKSKDGKPFINYMRMLVRDSRTYNKRNFPKIVDFLSNNYFNNEHFEKYNWLLEELKSEIQIGLQHYEAHPEFAISRAKIRSIKKLQAKIEII